MTLDDQLPEPASRGSWDYLAEQLQRWRQAAGDPSFTEISTRISRRREQEGVSPAAARVGRTTVYDAFRTGRIRVNLDLVREIARALDVPADEIERWVTRDAAEPSPAPSPAATPAVPAPVTADPPAGPLRVRTAVILMAACLALNFIGILVVELLQLPVYLDMTGTAIAAIALGPWRGALVGLGTNALGMIMVGWISLPFAVVNVAGALVWGYGVRRWGLGRSLGRFFSLNVLVALTCTLIAVPVLVLLFGGSAGHGQDTLTATFFQMTHTFVVAVGFSNLLTSVGDKMISGFMALVVISTLPLGARLKPLLPFAAPPPPTPHGREA